MSITISAAVCALMSLSAVAAGCSNDPMQGGGDVSDAATGGAGGSDSGGGGGGGSGSGARSGKRGVAYGFTSEADLEAVGSSVSWWYTWGATPNRGTEQAIAALGIEFVPMVWGGQFNVSQLATQIPAGAKYLLGFNEPNFGAQSNLTPEAAAALWPQLEQLADQRQLKLVSPALNYCGGQCNETNPFVWLQKFFAACTGCRVDYIALHWYACTKEALQSYLKDYKARFNKPLWLTEFSCLDDATIDNAKESGYLKDALGILEADPIVFRYSWFTGRFDGKPVVNLLGDPGKLTPLGQSYRDFPAGP